jgi:hypothetical protein
MFNNLFYTTEQKRLLHLSELNKAGRDLAKKLDTKGELLMHKSRRQLLIEWKDQWNEGYFKFVPDLFQLTGEILNELEPKAKYSAILLKEPIDTAEPRRFPSKWYDTIDEAHEVGKMGADMYNCYSYDLVDSAGNNLGTHYGKKSREEI